MMLIEPGTLTETDPDVSGPETPWTETTAGERPWEGAGRVSPIADAGYDDEDEDEDYAFGDDYDDEEEEIFDEFEEGDEDEEEEAEKTDDDEEL